MDVMDHFFDGEDLTLPCSVCGAPYEMPDQRHDFGKLWWFDEAGQVQIRPYVKTDYDSEVALYG